MASASACQQKEEAKPLTQNEGPIASRLRSRSKTGQVQTSQTESTGGIDVNNQSADKPSRNQKDKSNKPVAKKREVHIAFGSRTSQPSTSADKSTKKSNDSKPKSSKVQQEAKSNNEEHPSSGTQSKQDVKNQPAAKSKVSQTKAKASSNCITSKISENQEQILFQSSAPKITKPSSTDVAGKEKEKIIPSQNQAKKSKKEHMIYYIRWKGFDRIGGCCNNCGLCGKDIACSPNEEEEMKHEENELRHFFPPLGGVEQGNYSRLPEASVFPCSHVFHSLCLSAMQLSEFSDPPCPSCVTKE